MEDHAIQTVDGRVVKVQSVSDTLIALIRQSTEKEFRANGVVVDTPSYAVAVVGGETVAEPHNETTLETDEEKAAWRDYVAGRALLRKEQNRRILKFKLTHGIVFDMPQDTKWEDDHRALGVEVPEPPDEKRYHYLVTEILKTQEDMLQALQAIDVLTYKNVISEEEIAAAIDNFRHQLRRKGVQPKLGKVREVEVVAATE